MALFVHNDQKWRILNKTERKLFAELVLEGICWNNYLDCDGTTDLDNDVSRDLDLPFIGKYKRSLRDALWWHCLKCACYENISISSAVEESALAALIVILRECVFDEIDVGSDYVEESEEPEVEIYFFSRYRAFVEKIYRDLYDVNDKTLLYDNSRFSVYQKLAVLKQIQPDAIEKMDWVTLDEFKQILKGEELSDAEDLFAEIEIEAPDAMRALPIYQNFDAYYSQFKVPIPAELFENVDPYYWNDLLAAIEDSFTAGDEQYQMQEAYSRGEIICEDKDWENKYFGEATILKQLKSETNRGYWDLLFACLFERDLPKFEELSSEPYQETFLDTLRSLNSERVSYLDTHLINSCYSLASSL